MEVAAGVDMEVAGVVMVDMVEVMEGAGQEDPGDCGENRSFKSFITYSRNNDQLAYLLLYH